MTQQFYPDVNQIMAILMGEMPQGVYAEDFAIDPTGVNNSSTSAETRAHAQYYANLYANLASINDDKFISTIDPDGQGLGLWELELFNAPQDPTQTFAQRQNNLLVQFRTQGGINFDVINGLVGGILNPLSLPYQIIQWNGNGVGAGPGVTGGWILDESILDVGTWLAAIDPRYGEGRDPGLVGLDCNLNYTAAGITAQQMAEIQTTAYTYEVQIFGNANAATLSKLDAILTKKEPARSTHVISNNTPLPIAP